VAYEELKERQSAMWGNGPYQRITETLEDIHERLIEALGPAPGDRWLDEAVARELARVSAPGGRIALANWTPEGGIGKLFKVMAPYQPAPPPSSPFDWGKEDRVHALLRDAFDLEIEKHVNVFRAETAEAMWELFSTSYGPTKTLAEGIGERREDLHRDWVEFYEANYKVNGEIAQPSEYLLISGVRR
jgi:hypothetical protein